MKTTHVIEDGPMKTTIEERYSEDDDTHFIVIEQDFAGERTCEWLEVDPQLALILSRLLRGWGEAH